MLTRNRLVMMIAALGALSVAQLAHAQTGSPGGARAQGKPDPYTDGARSDKFDPYTQGANASTRSDLAPTGKSRDPYTDGARTGARDAYTDGARTGARNPYTDGAKSSDGSPYSHGGNTK